MCFAVYRGRVIEELVATERTFCSSLWTLLDSFASRLRQNGVISGKDVR